MKFLSCEKLSEHKYKTPEGYLICVDSVLARTGKQTYKRAEVFGPNCKDADVDVEIDRPEKEVFSEKTLASFENKPLTVEHPDTDVNVDNHNELAVGFVRDIKRGNIGGNDVMLGTLVITDAKTIEEIENGEHTDLSCGYDCDINDEENPCQRNIRGNHVALCQQGRAGIARIVDSVKDKKYEWFIRKLHQPANGKYWFEIADRLSDKHIYSLAETEEEANQKLKEAEKLNDSVKDEDAQYNWMVELDRNNIDYVFINGGYGMEFRNQNDYTKAKELAKKVNYTQGHWDDKKLTSFDYRSTRISNELDSVKDSLKTFEVEYKDGNNVVIQLVKAKSLEDAIKKAKKLKK